MLGISLLLACSAAAAAVAQEPELQRSTTLPIERELGRRMEEFEAAVSEGRVERAAALLQELLESDPALLLPAASGPLVRGAAAAARARIATLPQNVAEARSRLLAARAVAALAAALTPPDPELLIEVERRFAGLPEAARARTALAELSADRGQDALARSWDASVPAASCLLKSEPMAPARMLSLGGHDAAALPRVDAQRLGALWSFSFQHSPPFGALVRNRLAITEGMVFASDGIELAALEAGSGRLRWHHRGDPRWYELEPERVNLLEEASSAHFLNIPVLAEGVVLCVLQETQPLGRVDSYSRIDIRRHMPARRLHAFDAQSGRLLWSMSTAWDVDPEHEPREVAAGPPAVSGGRVYLPVYDAIGTIDFSLLALDLRTGRRLWKRFLASGQLETNLFGNVLRELATPPPVADLARVQVCSHLGTVHALDAASGEVLWTRAYPRLSVIPNETGRIAERPQLLASNLGAGDGNRVAWAPVDCDRIILCDARNGSLLGEWPALNPQGQHASSLLALTPDGILATGTRIFELSASESTASRSSPPLDPDFEGGQLWIGRAATLVEGEVLVPVGTRSIERYDAGTLAPRGRALEFEDYLASGALQAAPGLLFVVQANGLTAWASLPALLSALRDPTSTLESLASVLPVAASLNLDGDREMAKGFAEASQLLSKRREFSSRASELELLAARSWISAGEFPRAVDLLKPLTTSAPPPFDLEACGLLLDEPLLEVAGGKAIAAALATVRRIAPKTLRTRAGEEEPAVATLARARALLAMDEGDSQETRRALAALLLLDEAGKLTVRGIPLVSWADAMLAHLLENPSQAAAYEREAREALAGSPLSQPLLRAFGRAVAVQEHLAAELQRSDLNRAERLQRARWRREWGDPARDWPDLAAWFPDPSPLPPLPQALERGSHWSLGTALLAWRPTASGPPRLFLIHQNSVISVRLEAKLPAEEFAFPLDGLRGFTGALASGSFPTPAGCAALMPQELLHFGSDGVLNRFPLASNYLDYDPLLPRG